MKWRTFYLPVFFLILACLLFPVSQGKETEGRKPNILFILVDDFAYDALGKTSEGQVSTPVLDTLKEQGCSFSHTFNPGSWTPAVCQASRTMLETGRSVWKAAKFRPQKEKDAPLWSRLMKKAGYETYFTGKWHVEGVTPGELFDHTGTVRSGMPEQSEDCYNRKFIPGQPDKWRPDDTSYGGYWKGGRHWSEVAADEACRFLNEASAGKSPFFMYVAFNAPHDPRQSSAKYLNLYSLEKIRMPEAFLPEYPYNAKIGAGRQLRDERLSPFPRTELSIKTNRKEYYSMITHLDEQIGRILDRLKKQVKTPTYVIFTSDQGLSLGDHGFMGKQNLYDPSIRVPLFITGPGIKKRAEIDSPVYMQSIMPTCLEIAGLPRPEQVIYPSLLKSAETGTMEGKEKDIYGAMYDSQRMIRTGKWRMLIYLQAGIVRLFDREKDPHELKDIAGDAGTISVMEDLYARFKVLQKENDDALNLDSVFTGFMDKICCPLPDDVE